MNKELCSHCSKKGLMIHVFASRLYRCFDCHLKYNDDVSVIGKFAVSKGNQDERDLEIEMRAIEEGLRS